MDTVLHSQADVTPGKPKIQITAARCNQYQQRGIEQNRLLNQVVIVVQLPAARACSSLVRDESSFWPGLTANKLCGLNVTMVDDDAAPGRAPLRSGDTEQVSQWPLIHSRTHVDDWAEASRAMGVDLSKNPQGLFNDSF